MKTASPENKDQADAIADDLKTYASLEALTASDGGKLIIKGLRKDILSAIDKLIASYRTAPEIELRTTCAVLGERFTLLRAFVRAPKQKQGAQKELDELLTVDS